MKTQLRIASLSLFTILCLVLSATAFAQIIYQNGPTNGNLNGFFFDGPGFGHPTGQDISDQFTPSLCPGGGCVGGTASVLTFAEWVPIGNTPTAVAWALGSTPFGNELSGDLGKPVALSSTHHLFDNGFGYSIFENTVGISGNLSDPNGTYYLSLSQAQDSGGTFSDAWDVNEGPALCFFRNPNGSGDCPATESESFTIGGGSGGTTPEPGSLMLFGSGILGVAGVLRRRLMG
jgi:hypothetical protein